MASAGSIAVACRSQALCASPRLAFIKDGELCDGDCSCRRSLKDRRLGKRAWGPQEALRLWPRHPWSLGFLADTFARISDSFEKQPPPRVQAVDLSDAAAKRFQEVQRPARASWQELFYV